jgi:hypothetical protein
VSDVPPDMLRVLSTSVRAIGYDGRAEELYVEWAGGDTYVYSPVPRAIYDGLLNAPSKGAYLNKVVKPTYDYRTV